MRPTDWQFPLFADHQQYDRRMTRLSDVHIHHGSKCNRRCAFCIVDGRPDGWYEPMTEASLDVAFDLVPVDGTIKFYGGEPTLDLPNLLWAMHHLRGKGFRGWSTIFSNGVQADTERLAPLPIYRERTVRLAPDAAAGPHRVPQDVRGGAPEPRG